MPVTVRYSASLDQTYEEDGMGSTDHGRSLLDLPSAASPAPSDDQPSCSSSSGGEPGTNSPVLHDGGPGGDRRMTFHDRTCSLDSLNDGSLSSGGGGSSGGGSHSRQLSSESCAGGEFIPTRTVKSTVKPAFNPMQFVKTGASQLGRKAEAQIKRYEEVKKVKEMVKEEEEEWQSNLDNWKSKRRHFSKKTVTRAEEIKQLNEEELERSRRRNKTFNEMMEERSKRASASMLPVWNDDENEIDDKDSAINNNNNNSSKCDVSFESSGSDHTFNEDEDDHHHHRHMDDGIANLRPAQSNGNGHENFKANGKHLASDAEREIESHHNKRGAPTKVPENVHGKISNGTGANAPPPVKDDHVQEEYTFDKAILSYTQYAESRSKGKVAERKLSSSSTASSTGERQRATPSSRMNGDDSDDVVFNGRSNGSSARTPSPDADSGSTRSNVQVHREEGEEMMILVCLKRGSESKDFGFATKSVTGGGTGPFVESVTPASPADEAGLRVSDEILAINGESCTAKRTHSAIVFAIKQAVYTGRLELSVYRYKNPELAILRTTSLALSNNVQGADKNSFVEGRGQRFSTTNGAKGSSTSATSREQSPKVDVVKRRSMFESSVTRSNPDRGAQNRRSLDVSSQFKNKLASFENLDACETEIRHSPSRDTSFKEKLASFKSLDSLERARKWDSSSPDAAEGVHVRQKQNSCDNLIDHPQPKNGCPRNTDELEPTVDVSRIHVLETRQSFEIHQSFERSQSCEFLDSMTSSELVSSPMDGLELCDTSAHLGPKSASSHLIDTHYIDNKPSYDVDPHLTQANRSEPLVHQSNEFGHDLLAPQETTFLANFYGGDSESGGDSSLLELVTRDETVTSYIDVSSHPYCDVDAEPLVPDTPTNKSSFELADSLEETAITGSLPSSPRTIAASRSGPDSYDSEDFDIDTDYCPVVESSHEALTCLSHSGDHNLELAVSIDLTVADNVIIAEDFELPIVSLPPPSEKPPPPPVDSEGCAPEVTAMSKNVNLRRVDSTKRIRKEISKRRSDFLGIDGEEVQNFIDNEISNVSPPPKMDEFLKADRELSMQCRQELLRSEQDRHKTFEYDSQMYEAKQSSKCSSLNLSNEEFDIDVNGGDSEIASQERVWNISNNVQQQFEQQQFQQEEQFYQQLKEHQPRPQHNERVEIESVVPIKQQPAHSEEAQKLREREEELRRQEEKLQLEKKKLREEQESLLKIKEAYQKQIEEHQRGNVPSTPPESPEFIASPPQQQAQHQQQPATVPASPTAQDSRTRQAPPPPTKPKIRTPSPRVELNGHDSSSTSNIQSPTFSGREDGDASDRLLANRQPLEHEPTNNATSPTTTPSKKQVLYALSASPKAKLVDPEQWMATRRRTEVNGDGGGTPASRRDNYNQHWVVQEAEFRRLHAPERPRNAAGAERDSPLRRSVSSDVLGESTALVNQRKPMLDSPIGATQNYDSPANLNGHSSNSPNSSHNQKPNFHHHQQPQQQSPMHPRPPPPNKPLPPLPTAVNSGYQGSPQTPVTAPFVPPHQQQNRRSGGNPNSQMASPSSGYATGLPHHPQGALPSPPLTHGQSNYQQSTYQQSPHQTGTGQPIPSFGINGLQPRSNQERQGDARLAAQTPLSPSAVKNGQIFDKETQMLSVSGKKKCSHCSEELGRGAAMIIESLQLFYHINCFKCCVCHTQLGNGSSGADVRVRSQKLHCHNCYSNDEGLKFSKV